MNAEDIRKLYWAERFRPFRVVLQGGREILVAKREHISIAVTADRIAIAPTIEDFEIIDMADVTGVRTFGPLATSVPSLQHGAA